MAAVYDYAGGWRPRCRRRRLAVTKLQLYTDLHRDAAASARYAEEAMRAMMTGPDFAEGVAALTEHRAPRFADRPPGPVAPGPVA